jgi:hypothetical protein
MKFKRQQTATKARTECDGIDIPVFADVNGARSDNHYARREDGLVLMDSYLTSVARNGTTTRTKTPGIGAGYGLRRLDSGKIHVPGHAHHE